MFHPDTVPAVTKWSLSFSQQKKYILLQFSITDISSHLIYAPLKHWTSCLCKRLLIFILHELYKIDNKGKNTRRFNSSLWLYLKEKLFFSLYKDILFFLSYPYHHFTFWKSHNIQIIPNPAKRKQVLMEINSCSPKGGFLIHCFMARAFINSLRNICQAPAVCLAPGEVYTLPALFLHNVVVGNTNTSAELIFCLLTTVRLHRLKFLRILVPPASSVFSRNRCLLRHPDLPHEFMPAHQQLLGHCSSAAACSSYGVVPVLYQLVSICNSVPGGLHLIPGLAGPQSQRCSLICPPHPFLPVFSCPLHPSAAHSKLCRSKTPSSFLSRGSRSQLLHSVTTEDDQLGLVPLPTRGCSKCPLCR